MNGIIAAIISGSVAIVIAVLSGTLAINNNMAGVKAELAVMRQREDERDKKIAQMWEWWLLTLQNGWMAEMKRAKGAGGD